MNTPAVIKSTVAALVLAFVPNILAQTSASGASNPKVENKAATPAPAQAGETQGADLSSMNVSLCYEAFSLPIAKAGELQRKGMTDEELYKEVIAAGKLERLLILRTKSAQRAVLENTTYYIYPTEFMMPEIPSPRKQSISLPIAATAYEKKGSR